MKMLIAAVICAATLAGYGILGNGITPASAQDFNERGPSLSETVTARQADRPIRYNTNTYNAIYGPRDLRDAGYRRDTRYRRNLGIYADTSVPNSFNMRTLPSSEDVFPTRSQRRVLRPYGQKECEIVTSAGFNERTPQTTC